MANSIPTVFFNTCVYFNGLSTKVSYLSRRQNLVNSNMPRSSNVFNTPRVCKDHFKESTVLPPFPHRTGKTNDVASE